MQRSSDENGGTEPQAPQELPQDLPQDLPHDPPHDPVAVVDPAPLLVPDVPPVAIEPVAVEPEVPAPPPRPTLTDLLDDYEGRQPADARHSRERLEHAIEASPVLKTMLQRAIADGALDRFTFGDAPDGAGGSYSPGDRSMNLNASSFRTESNLVFVLGHETQHALSLQGQAAPYQTALTAAIAQRADLAAPLASLAAPRDYTDVVRDVVEGTRREEAQAHIGGFNALASYVRHERHLDRAPTLKELYQTEPGRMSDFINVSGLIFKDYALKPGLAREADGSMALSDGNIDRMKVYYADKFPGTFGDNGLMDYRNQAIHGAWQEIHAAERTYVDHHATLAATAATGIDGQLAPGYAPLHHAYSIDFATLGASPAVLKFPGNGVVEVTDTMHAFATRQQSGMPMSNQELQGIREAVDPLRTAVVPTPEANRALNRRVAIDAPPDPGAASAPEPALLQQARQAMEKLGPNGGLADGTAFGNAAATLAAAAQKDGLTAIDHVVKSVDGERLIAVQGQDPASPDARHAAVEIAQAVRQPAEQTLHSLQAQASPSPGVATDTPQHAPKGHGL